MKKVPKTRHTSTQIGYFSVLMMKRHMFMYHPCVDQAQLNRGDESS